MTDRKKPGEAFWATVVLVVVLVGCPLSVGPAWWLANQEWCPAWVYSAYWPVYSPIWRATTGTWVEAILLQYCYLYYK